MNSTQHGFNLIDGLIVIAIIGMVGTLAVPLYRNYQDQALGANAQPASTASAQSLQPVRQ